MTEPEATILWCSNYRHKKLGYSRQTNIWLPLLQESGYRMVDFAMTEDFGGPFLDSDGIPTVSQRWEKYGSDVYPSHMAFFQPDFSFGLFNGWVPDREAFLGQPHAQWEPIDSEPLRPDVLDFLKICRWVITMTRFGERVAGEAGLNPLYVPHGIDGRIYHPMDRTAARARLQERIDTHEKMRGFPVKLGDRFLVAMNGANFYCPGRKGWWEALTAWKGFHDRHPGALLYIHTALREPDGLDLLWDMQTLDIPQGSVVYPNQYFYTTGMIPDGDLADLYNAADVFFHPSHTEGFGLPVVEAQMCGTPVIVTDASAMHELGECGIRVPGKPYEAVRGWLWVRPDPDDLVEALEDAYQGKVLTRDVVSEWAQQYEAKTVLKEHMLPALERITRELGETPDQRYKREMSERRRVTVNGVSLTIRPGVWDWAIAKTVQRDYFADIIDYTKIKRAVDVGAHIGAWSLWVKSKSSDARIVAIEAMHENAELLRQNCNGKNADSITVIEGMVGYTPGEYDLLIDAHNSGGPTLVKRGAPMKRFAVGPDAPEYQYRQPYEGQRFDLESILFGLKSFDVDILKLDCEGGEFDILNHAGSVELRAFKFIVGEYHNELGDIDAALKRLEPWFSIRARRPLDHNFGLFCLERKEDAVKEHERAV